MVGWQLRVMSGQSRDDQRPAPVVRDLPVIVRDWNVRCQRKPVIRSPNRDRPLLAESGSSNPPVSMSALAEKRSFIRWLLNGGLVSIPASRLILANVR